MISLQRVVLSLAIVVSSVVAAAPSVSAQDSAEFGEVRPSGGFDSLDAAAVGVTLGLGTLALAMTVHDIVSFAMDAPFDDGWAVTELVIGTLWTAIGVVAGVASVQNPGPVGITVSTLGIAFGSTNITHGVWSLVTNDAPPPVTPMIAPSADGGLILGVSGAL